MAADLADRIGTAIADAGVGAEPLVAELATIEGIGVEVVSGTASLCVSVPVPSARLRDRLESDLRAAVQGVDGITTVEVDFRPDVPDPGHRADILPGVKNVIAVASGKGGVGKSTVATNLAVALADAGATVGLLDADVYGSNAPSLLGLDDSTPTTTADARIVPRSAEGLRVMSMDFVVDEQDPIIWRGPMVDDVLKQLTADTAWGDLDYLIVDLPPGTGDAQLTLVQYLPLAGAVIVTTPEGVAVGDARRGLEGFVKYDVPILGIVENMGGFECPDCGTTHELFGAGGADALADEFDVPVIGRLPLDPAVGTLTTEEQERGVDLPVIGRIGLPRTQAERGGRLPPVASRDDGATSAAFRVMAARVAGRAAAAAVEREPASPG